MAETNAKKVVVDQVWALLLQDAEFNATFRPGNIIDWRQQTGPAERNRPKTLAQYPRFEILPRVPFTNSAFTQEQTLALENVAFKGDAGILRTLEVTLRVTSQLKLDELDEAEELIQNILLDAGPRLGLQLVHTWSISVEQEELERDEGRGVRVLQTSITLSVEILYKVTVT